MLTLWLELWSDEVNLNLTNSCLYNAFYSHQINDDELSEALVIKDIVAVHYNDLEIFLDDSHSFSFTAQKLNCLVLHMATNRTL